MTEKNGKRLSPRLRKELWRRWREGETAAEVARSLAVNLTSVYSQIWRCGGFEPAIGRRPDSLTEHEREEISRCVAQQWSVRRIARHLGRAPSTISRELRRNGGRSRYRALPAEWTAWRRARRPKPCKLSLQKRLCNIVARKLTKLWSPQQVARWLQRRYGQRTQMRVSHETIYKTLFVQARGALKQELVSYLRRARDYRRPRAHRVERMSVADGISIRERPAEVEDRAVPGHWEGDLLFGNVHSYIATLVERKTRYCMLVKVPGKEPTAVAAALQKIICRLPAELRKSLTWDRGAELSEHAAFTVETGVPVYFCDPRSPWQRGTNENTNGLLRQFFPRGKDVSRYTQPQLNKIARLLNERPRMTLDWRSPAEALNEVLR